MPYLKPKDLRWTYDFLWSKGLRGNKFRLAWTIACRESGGIPSRVTLGRMNWNWNSNGDQDSTFFDVGLFQVNNRHLNTIKSRWGSDKDMRLMFNPNRAFDMFMDLSDNVTDLADWAIQPTGNGYDFDWSKYTSQQQQNNNLRQITESNHAAIWSWWPQYNLNSMGESQNGWPILRAGNDPRLKSKNISGLSPKRSLLLREEVLPLFMSFARDYDYFVEKITKYADDFGYTPPSSAGSAPADNLASGTAIRLNSMGSGSIITASHPNYKSWSQNTTARTRLGQLLDSYDLIHWAGPQSWGGRTAASSVTTAYDMGLFYLKPEVDEEAIKNKMEVLGITSTGVRKYSLPNGP